MEVSRRPKGVSAPPLVRVNKVLMGTYPYYVTHILQFLTPPPPPPLPKSITEYYVNESVNPARVSLSADAAAAAGVTARDVTGWRLSHRTRVTRTCTFRIG
ncbi:hypothetical protein EVAR_47703_1 [Eumeta japonica]|uniref:Uncharacterized protein n=1 Tax=Eumeta variegata TaxID=151549 RepID=A0A4C1XR19_EUMVA|nr:hypothetical protein EVAR_47703_1 [Eumeta japonica]